MLNGEACKAHRGSATKGRPLRYISNKRRHALTPFQRNDKTFRPCFCERSFLKLKFKGWQNGGGTEKEQGGRHIVNRGSLDSIFSRNGSTGCSHNRRGGPIAC